MISVYRVYLGRSWAVAGEAASLLGLFDALPEFLHAPCALERESLDLPAEAVDARRASVKIAMTHAHVAILWGGVEDPAPDWTGHEIYVASTSFRRRIPMLAVMPPGVRSRATLAHRVSDRSVGWNALDVARAVQELAEMSSAARRGKADRMSPQGLHPLALRPAPILPSPGEPGTAIDDRPLPTLEISQAYNQFKAARAPKTPPPGSV